MTYLLDTDVVIALSECDLLCVLHKILRAPYNNILVSDELGRRLASGKYRAKLLTHGVSQIAIDRATDFASQRAFVAQFNRDDYLDLLAAGLDHGEASLFAGAENYNDARVVTADFNCLKDITDHFQGQALWSKLAGKAVCMEQLLKAANSGLSFKVFSPAFDTGRHQIGYVELSQPYDEAELIAALNRNIGRKRTRCPGLLFGK